MTDLPVHDLEHAARGVARLIDRYAKPRNQALLASWLDEVQQVEDALWQLYVERSLATAEGDQLDVLGAIVGEPRLGRDDETYRLWISARNMVNRSSGITTEMLAIARKLIPPPPYYIELSEYYPAAFIMRIVGGALPLADAYQIARMLHLAKGGGIQFGLAWTSAPDEGTFTFAPADAVVPASSMGFDEGVWAGVAEGTYVPPAEPELPPGVIVIDGVPLVIDGSYLVITPPAALAAATPVVARSVRVVPHAVPLALPTPLVGGTIELADAFSDASLEMDAEGDQFRVATALQAAIADVQADVADLAGELGAMRFAFTQRTTTVVSTTYEEIGLLRFDATPFGASWNLVAELEVAAGGQTAELELYNLTAGASVTTLSSTSTTTEKQTAAIVLPLSEALYSVRLRRSGGTSSEFVSCRAVAFER